MRIFREMLNLLINTYRSVDNLWLFHMSVIFYIFNFSQLGSIIGTSSILLCEIVSNHVSPNTVLYSLKFLLHSIKNSTSDGDPCIDLIMDTSTHAIVLDQVCRLIDLGELDWILPFLKQRMVDEEYSGMPMHGNPLLQREREALPQVSAKFWINDVAIHMWLYIMCKYALVKLCQQGALFLVSALLNMDLSLWISLCLF